MKPEEYLLLKKRIRDILNFDLENYKTNQMMRRLDGYIARTGTGGVVQYCSLLISDKKEQKKLKDFLTINVTEFFRDSEYYETLEKNIIPMLLRNSAKLNIWSAGCANGAEAYSLAIILDQTNPFHNHRILATDIDEKSLSVAIEGGPYSLRDIKNVPDKRRSRYFSFHNNAYWIIPRIRMSIEFKKHDLLRDEFEQGFDLIVCRNVIIYFTEAAKKELRDRFIQSLKPDGILFIGATETMLDAESVGMERLYPCFFKKTGTHTFRKESFNSTFIRSGVRRLP